MRRIVSAIAVLLAALTLAAGFWGMVAPGSFASFVNFPPSVHFVHDAGAFQLGLGAALLLGVVWGDGFTVGLGGYLVAGVAHTASHIADRDVGGASSQTVLIAVSAALAAIALVERWRQLGWVLGRVDGTAAPEWAPFVRQKTVALTTFRRDGTPVTTPVSIVVAGEHVYVRSYEKAWKTRRLRRNPNVTVAPSTARGKPTGPAVPAVARRLTGGEQAAAAAALRAKYPLLHGAVVPLTHRLGRRTTGRTVHFELARILHGGNGAPQPDREATVRIGED